MDEIRLLIISKSVLLSSPQATRFRNFIKHWSDFPDVRIDLVSIHDPDFKEKKVTFIPKRMTRIGKKLISSDLVEKRKNYQTAAGKKSFLKILAKFINYRSFFFPDVYCVEIPSLARLISKLKSGNYNIVIISAFPFSFLSLARQVRKNWTESLMVYDTGDPFFRNKSKYVNGVLHKLFSKRFEKKNLQYFDILVVPNDTLKNHYSKHFNSVISDENIIVIPQGTTRNSIIPQVQVKKARSNLFIYAGKFYPSLREPYEMYNAFEKMPDLSLEIYGPIQDKFITDIPNISFAGIVSQEEIAKHYQIADVIVLIDNRDGIQIPGKIFEILAANKPILFIYYNEDSPTLDLIKGYDFVIKAKNESRQIISAMNEILEKEKYNFNFDISNYSWPELAEDYFQKITSRSR